ncbi:MAG TPA: hypothetical protein VLA93_21790 [Pyrinomonadaceae bacterium]|nr:hypothetical protein [Pyrinomonadaceae bacterium]
MNYFNYFTEIEDTFVRRRGKHLFLSPMDWALMESWKQRDIPLHLVLRSIERAFDSFEARPRKRSVKSLLYCQEEVEAQFAEWLESRVGANESSEERDDDSAKHFSTTAIETHLREKKKILQHLVNSVDNAELSETLGRAIDRLSELETDVANTTALDARRLEDSLTGVDRMLGDALVSQQHEQVKVLAEEIKTQLKPYRSQMDQSAYKQTFNNLLLKQIREKSGIPRLSLFYL